ncbi:TPA: hypothetical protein ACXI7E_002836 [Pseudomonas aeruginosa]
MVEQIKRAVSALPSYGYHRVRGLLRRQYEQQALLPVKMNRACRVMRDHDLLLGRRRKQPGVVRRYEGRAAVDMYNAHWCSDGFEFRCEDGEELRGTFSQDCAVGWLAQTVTVEDQAAVIHTAKVVATYITQAFRGVPRVAEIQSKGYDEITWLLRCKSMFLNLLKPNRVKNANVTS